ncbi:MAG: topoisomerase II [Propionibacteriales bacterium]|nr:topoisomerase II [Propionibacteriales bacterium]
MGKRARTKGTSSAAGDGAVGPRQPCPCGSGKRYKACHGAGDRSTPFVVRTFDGLPDECDWVALREFVPSATAPLTVRGTDREVQLCSLLPMAWPALVRPDGSVWGGLQVQHSSGDISRDLAYALQQALDGEPGDTVAVNQLPGAGDRMQDLVAQEGLDITVHDGFAWWVDDVDDPTGEVAASVEQANAAATPTRRLTSVDAAYWCDVGTKEHLRWVLPHGEERLLSALARLHRRGADTLVDGSRLVGSFRAHGLLVPVWDLEVGTGADALEEAAAEFATRLDDALADESALTSEERSARAGLANRQLTIR